MMILSLNAPRCRLFRRHQRQRDCDPANDFLASKWQNGRRGFRRLPRCRCRIPISRSRSSSAASRRSAPRALVNGFSQIGDGKRRSIRPAAILAVLGAVEQDRPALLPAFRASAAEDCAIYEGHPWLMGPTWAFGQETAVHALRLMDRAVRCPSKAQDHPRHMGEGLPTACGASIIATAGSRRRRSTGEKEDLQLLQRQLLPDHVRQFPHADADRFHSRNRSGPHPVSVDWPFENVDHASDWSTAPASARTIATRSARRNAIDLFKLDLGETAVAGHGIHQAAE